MHVFVDTVELSHNITGETKWIRLLKLWWGFSSKFFMPWILWHLTLLLDVGQYFGKKGEASQGDELEEKGPEKTKLLFWELVKFLYVLPFFIFVAFFLFKNYDEEDFEFENKLIGDIPDNTYVLTYAIFDDLNEKKHEEAFYCWTKYTRS